MISAGKGAKATKPNQPKVDIAKVASGAAAPVTPFGGRMQTGGGQRAGMAQELLQQGSGGGAADLQNQEYLKRLSSSANMG